MLAAMAGAYTAWRAWLASRPRLRALFDALLVRVTIDTRALALMRIGLALAVVSDALMRWGDVETLYADGGVIAPGTQPWSRTLFPLYDAFGSLAQVRAWLVVTVLAGVVLALGYRTRLMMLLAWWLMAALHVRNVWVLQDGDYVLQQLLLISCLLPCGARWSLDARRKHGSGAALWWCAGPATVLLVFQMMHLYMSTGLIKMRFPHWWLGDGVAYGLQADHFVTPLGVWLRNSGIPLEPLSLWTILLEALGPVVWLLARPGSRWRTAVWLSFVTLHLGIAATIHVGLFSFVCLVLWLFAVPSPWLDRIERMLARRSAKGRTRPLGRAVACVPRQRWVHVLGWLLLLYLPLASAVHDLTQSWRKPPIVLAPAWWLSLKLRWAVFSGPRTKTGWYLIAATQQDGHRIDLVSGQRLSFKRPDNMLDVFPNQRWRKLWVNFRKGRAPHLRKAYLHMLCRQHPRLRDVELIYMKRAVRLDGVIPAAARHRVGYLRCPQSGAQTSRAKATRSNTSRAQTRRAKTSRAKTSRAKTSTTHPSAAGSGASSPPRSPRRSRPAPVRAPAPPAATAR